MLFINFCPLKGLSTKVYVPIFLNKMGWLNEKTIASSRLLAHSCWLLLFLPTYVDGVLTTAYLINIMSSQVLHLQTPFECLKEFYPTTRLIPEAPLCVCVRVPYLHSSRGLNHTEFVPRVQSCAFVGYPLHKKGYKCYHPHWKYLCTWMSPSLRKNLLSCESSSGGEWVKRLTGSSPSFL